jgi:hypothetical protein
LRKSSSGRPLEYQIDPLTLEWQQIACAPEHKELIIGLIQGVAGIEKFAPDNVQRKEGFRARQEYEVDPVYPKQVPQFKGKVHSPDCRG